ncbi:ABC transporter substrate-binding protein [Arcobacter sp.]|uniref:ABC transporter substrate-binding protein n=1 Tax=unclassified Arcobacter TaxID=2593671 RepID=UPI003AFFDA29
MKISQIFLLGLFFLVLNACDDKSNDSHLKYKNQTITILSPNFDKAITGPIKKEVKEFEDKTGATIRIVSPSWDDMIPKIKESFVDEKINYDVFVIFSSWAGSLLADGHAEEIPKWVEEKIDWQDVLPIYKENVLSWNDKYYFLPYDGDCINLYYRKDIFENEEYKKRFKKIYNYNLEVPKTWKQYKDIAEFFNAWDWNNDGKIEYGVAESRRRGYGTLLQFFAKAAAYAKYPNNKEFYFDMNMNPKINNPAFIKALEDYIDIMKYAPKEILNFAPSDVRQSFIAGNVSMAIDWANTGALAQNSKESIVKNKVGYAELPGSNRVYNSKTNKWENLYNNPSSISGNWVIVVNKDAKNKELALNFAAYLTSKEMTTRYVPVGWSGINPSRYSHLSLTNLDLWENNSFSKNSAKDYLKVISNSLSNENVVMDIRIPGADLYYDSFDKYLNKAIIGELTPQEALDLTAQQWNKITKELGIENQIRFYKESLNE